jgi:hypothetical protein
MVKTVDEFHPLVVQLEDIPKLLGRTFRGGSTVVDRDSHDLFKRATWLDTVYKEPSPTEYPEEPGHALPPSRTRHIAKPSEV